MILHILNGDSTAESFRHTSLPGDVLVWREMLCEGWVPATPDFEEFWQERGDFLVNHYGFDHQEYETRALSEFRRLREVDRYDEITLWFEFDLFCQINLLYLLHFFAEKDVGETRLTLVSPGSHPDHPRFKGMGQLTPEQLAALWPERILLTPHDLRVGQAAWQAYTASTPDALLDFLNGGDFGQLYFLKTALNAHLSRFPAEATGLGFVERYWLNALPETGQAVPTMTRFWDENPQFGFGDLQLLRTLDDLKAAGLVHENGRLALTDRAGAVLAGRENYRNFAPRPRFLGGVQLPA
jgi:hypothetical protein